MVILIISVVAVLALLMLATIVGARVGVRASRRYRRKDALDIVHAWVSRSGRR